MSLMSLTLSWGGGMCPPLRFLLKKKKNSQADGLRWFFTQPILRNLWKFQLYMTCSSENKCLFDHLVNIWSLENERNELSMDS